MELDLCQKDQPKTDVYLAKDEAFTTNPAAFYSYVTYCLVAYCLHVVGSIFLPALQFEEVTVESLETPFPATISQHRGIFKFNPA